MSEKKVPLLLHRGVLGGGVNSIVPDYYFDFQFKVFICHLHEYTQNTETANNTDVYAASFTSNKVQRNHQIKWQKGARNLRRFMGPLTVEQVYFEKRNKTSAGSASAASSRYRAVLKLWIKYIIL